MEKIKKVFSLIVMIIFLYYNDSFGIIEKCKIRKPFDFNGEEFSQRYTSAYKTTHVRALSNIITEILRLQQLIITRGGKSAEAGLISDTERLPYQQAMVLANGSLRRATEASDFQEMAMSIDKAISLICVSKNFYGFFCKPGIM